MPSIRDHFPRPLQEVSAQVTLARRILLEFRADSFYQHIRDRFPDISGVPIILVPPPTEVPPAQLYGAAYRFGDKDGRHLVQLGPNLLAVNAITWEHGYAGYSQVVNSVIDAYCETHPNELANGFSLGFYNRLPINDRSDVAWLFRDATPFPDETEFAGFSLQRSRKTQSGLLTTQITTVEDGEQRHIHINNIVNLDVQTEPLNAKRYIAWLNDAHEIAKAAFWNSLSDDAQTAWDRTHAQEVK